MLMRDGGRKKRVEAGLIAVGVCLSLFAASGCERKERVIDVKTPAGDVQVDKIFKPDGDTKGVEVNAPGVQVNTKEN